MALLPFLLPLVVERWFNINPNAVARISTIMLIWNLSFAIIPSSISSFYDSSQIVRFLKENPNSLFLAADRNSIANEYEYVWGDTIYQRLIKPPIDEWVKKYPIQTGTVIYSDVVDRPNPMNRNRIVSDLSFIESFETKQPIYQLNGLLGTYSIYELEFIDHNK
ncbi:MAG: hypothetical protein QM786_19310 [Breznakibacter sp.]